MSPYDEAEPDAASCIAVSERYPAIEFAFAITASNPPAAVIPNPSTTTRAIVITHD